MDKIKNGKNMKSLFNIKINIFPALLILLVVFSFIPIFILIFQSLTKLDNIKNLSNETSETIVREQTAQICISEAQNVAKNISDFLQSCETDLEVISQLPTDSHAYLQFYKNHKKWVASAKSYIPLYKEIAFINKKGLEVVKIVDEYIVSKDQLHNVSDPKNTTYKSETYFEDTKTSQTGIFVSHLTGWYVSRNEQMNQGISYKGVIRFCKKISDDDNNLIGICMLALDHFHIMDFIWREPNLSLLDIYKTGNYNYLIDDEGWIIAHPKLWDIRGLNKDGILIEPIIKQTPQWKIDAGLIPINLTKMDWRLRDIYTNEPMSNIIERIRRGETAVYTMVSSGIYQGIEGKIRTRACAPILYSSGIYNKYGIAGGVVVGTAMENLVNKTKSFSSQIEAISKNTKNQMIIIAFVLSLGVFFLSFFFAKNISQAMLKLTHSLGKIGKGDLNVSDIKSPIKEITELSSGVKHLSVELKEKENKIKHYIKDLEVVNIKLGDAQKQLDSYWKHEYEIESAQVLEEKIILYQKDYPKLKEIRTNLCVGSSPQFLRVLRQIVPLSQMTIPAWIQGESGVGKTALGRSMHFLSPRNNKKFYIFEAVEFSAADPMIIMGKLFGFGSGHGLTGIDKNGQKGVLEECDGGTLIIDDVDALPLETQAQLLRVVDGLYFHPAAGKTRNINSDIRFIFISNIDLEQRVKEGLFRKDLFRRMGGSINKIMIPPLRKRKSDIAVLVNYFISLYNNRNNSRLQISEGAQQILTSHDYIEGNIGELRMIVELACESVRIESVKIITEEYLPPNFKIHVDLKNNVSSPQKEAPLNNFFNENEKKELIVLRKNHFFMEISEEQLGFKHGSKTLSHHLRGMCLKALSLSNWNINEAAKLITESSNNKSTKTIKTKIQGYINNIIQKGKNGQENSLYKNLPKEYHLFLEKTIYFLKTEV